MGILRKIFRGKGRGPISIDFDSFRCAWAENINLTPGMRARGTFSVTIEKDGIKTTNLVLGTNQTLLKEVRSDSPIASLQMMDVTDKNHKKSAIVELYLDGRIRASNNNELQTSIRIENIDFEPGSTTALNPDGSISQEAPSTEEKEYMMQQDRDYHQNISNWLDTIAPTTPYTAPSAPDGFFNAVNKISNSDAGAFFDVVEDLLAFEKSKEISDPVMSVAYMYSYRLAVAGLFFQGIESLDKYNFARETHEATAKYEGASPDQEKAGNEQGAYLVWRYAQQHDMPYGILAELDKYAQKGVDYYKLASQHNIDVEFIDIGDDEAACMSIENCIELIEWDLH